MIEPIIKKIQFNEIYFFFFKIAFNETKIFYDVLIFVLISFQKDCIYHVFVICFIKFNFIVFFRTPLYLAVLQNNQEIVKLLLNYNDTDVNAKSIKRYQYFMKFIYHHFKISLKKSFCLDVVSIIFSLNWVYKINIY